MVVGCVGFACAYKTPLQNALIHIWSVCSVDGLEYHPSKRTHRKAAHGFSSRTHYKMPMSHVTQRTCACTPLFSQPLNTFFENEAFRKSACVHWARIHSARIEGKVSNKCSVGFTVDRAWKQTVLAKPLTSTPPKNDGGFMRKCTIMGIQFCTSERILYTFFLILPYFCWRIKET